jgi:N-carbamoylputrescine amidase
MNTEIDLCKGRRRMREMLKICGIQMACVEDKDRNLKKAAQLAQLASEKGAKIICFQELFSTHWFPRDIDRAHFGLAEPIDGQTVHMMQHIAKEKSVVLICPMFEEGIEGVYYNTAVIIDADGRVLGKYRKAHVPQIPLWEEKFYFTPGDTGFPVFSTRYAKIGVQICWDNFFPEGTRVLALKGAQIIFAPTAAAFASQQKWETVYGTSFCVTPEGELTDNPSGMQEGIVFASIDLRDIGLARREWTFLRDRRPEVYREIAGMSWKRDRRVAPRAMNPRKRKEVVRKGRGK